MFKVKSSKVLTPVFKVHKKAVHEIHLIRTNAARQIILSEQKVLTGFEVSMLQPSKGVSEVHPMVKATHPINAEVLTCFKVFQAMSEKYAARSRSVRLPTTNALR